MAVDDDLSIHRSGRDGSAKRVLYACHRFIVKHTVIIPAGVQLTTSSPRPTAMTDAFATAHAGPLSRLPRIGQASEIALVMSLALRFIQHDRRNPSAIVDAQ